MNDTTKDEILLDGLMESATAYVFVDEMDALPSIEDLDQQYAPTPDLEKKIKNILDRSLKQSRIKKSTRRIIKIAACAAIMLTALSIVLVSVEATRNIIFNGILDWKENHTDIVFEDENTDGIIYRPSYLPEGFNEISSQTYGTGYAIIYMADDGEQIIFDQYPADTGLTSVDNEYTEYQEIQISGHTAYLFEATTDDDLNILIWENKGVVFKLSSKVIASELISISESIK